MTMSCSFCGTGRADVRFMMAGPTVAICGGCVVEAVRLMAHGDTVLMINMDTAAVYEPPPGEGRPAALGRGEFVEPGRGGGASPDMPPIGPAKGGPT